MTNDYSEPLLSGFVHRFIPAESRQVGPTLLLLHGTGGTETTLLNIGRMLAPGAALLSPRGQISENGALRFFRRLSEGVFDFDDLQRRTDELADFVVAASQAYQFEASQVVAVGYSNGANIAASILLLRPHILQRAILLRPMVPLVPIHCLILRLPQFLSVLVVMMNLFLSLRLSGWDRYCDKLVLTLVSIGRMVAII